MEHRVGDNNFSPGQEDTISRVAKVLVPWCMQLPRRARTVHSLFLQTLAASRAWMWPLLSCVHFASQMSKYAHTCFTRSSLNGTVACKFLFFFNASQTPEQLCRDTQIRTPNIYR
eukprot:119645-Amphidinium_carterae.1